jgi:hypothetical protein
MKSRIIDSKIEQKIDNGTSITLAQHWFQGPLLEGAYAESSDQSSSHPFSRWL